MDLRKVIFWMHLTCGVVAGMVIFIMSVTGVILTYEPQIVDFAERKIRTVAVPTKGSRLSLNEIVAQAQAAKPDAKVSGLMLQAEEDASVVVNFGRGKAVFVNPYTGEILGQNMSKTYEFMHTVEDWHRYLGARDKWRPVTGACNLIFLLLCVTGLYIWWPRSWNWQTVKGSILFNPQLKGKARDWNWHNVVGIWCVPFLIMITVSGLVMSYPWANALVYRLTGNEVPPAMNRKAESKDKKEETSFISVNYDALFRAAEVKVPEWRSINIRLGESSAKPATLSIEEPPVFGNPHPRSQLTLDVAGATVVKWEPFADQNSGRRLRTFLRYLHTGEVAGIAGQTIAGVASAGGGVLVWTGIAMALRRFTAWRERKST